MAKKNFKLPPISPLIGSHPIVYRKTMTNQVIAPQFNTKKRLTEFVMRLLWPFRKYNEKFYMPRARKSTPEDVVFIVGHWRSGTTYLHNLMCQAKNTSFVTTYQTVFPNFMGSKSVFKPFMRALMPDKRPSDNVKLDVNFPQEEEFAFSGMNPYAYYRFMYFPKNYQTYYVQSTSFTGLTSKEKEEFKRDYKELLSYAHFNNPGNLMIVKNPINTARIKFLHELYPHAKWIHIYRSPYTVYRSTLKFFTDLLPTLWFEPVSKEFIKKLVLDVYTRLYQDYDDSIASIPELDLIEIKFEDFEQDPIAHLKDIYSTLDLGDFEQSRRDFEQYIDSKKSYNKNVYHLTNDEVCTVNQHWGEYVHRWGYRVPN